MRRQNLRVLRSFGLDQVRQLASCKTLENSPGAAKKLHHSIRLERAPPLATPRTPGCSQRAAPPLLARKWELPAWEAARNTLSTGLQLGAALHAAATRRRPVFHTGAVGGVRRGATCWASRRCILGVLAIQRVDGPIIGDVDSPQQFKLLPWTTLRVFRRRNVANNGCFSRLPAGAAAGRRRATEILLGGGTRARLLNTAVRRDPDDE